MLTTSNKEAKILDILCPTAEKIPGKRWSRKLSALDVIEWSLLISLSGLLIACLIINKLKNTSVWEVELWRVCVFSLVIFCGDFISKWLTCLITFVIAIVNSNFIKSRLLYFIYATLTSATVVIWCGLIMVVWLVLIRERLEQSFSTDRERRIIHKFSRGMASFLAGVFLWFVKIYLIKLIAASFQMNVIFGRVRDGFIFEFVVQELEKIQSNAKKKKKKTTRENFVEKLKNMKQNEVSAIYMKQLIDNLHIMEIAKMTTDEIEVESNSTASRIMNRIQKQNNQEYVIIRKDSLGDEAYCRLVQQFESIVDDPIVEPLPEQQPNTSSLRATQDSEVKESSTNPPLEIKIMISDFTEWMSNVNKELQELSASLMNSDNAIDELNTVFSVLASVIILVVFLLLMGITTTEVLIFITSQLLVWSFVFNDTFKTVFGGVIFNFVLHPFDIGDECEINKEKMTVKKMGLLSTNFEGLKKDDKGVIIEPKVHYNMYYSNSALTLMGIINFTKASIKEEVSRIWK